MSGGVYGVCGFLFLYRKAKGITAFDVDARNGMFKERCEVEVDNSSYVSASE